MMRLNIWCKIKFHLVMVLRRFNCVWWFIRVVLHVGSGCQSNIKADCLDLLSRPAPVITRVEIPYKADHLFDKLTSRFVSLKINDLGIYRLATLYKTCTKVSTLHISPAIPPPQGAQG